MNKHKHSPLDDYDRMSDYYWDLENVHPKEKGPSSVGADKEQIKNKLTESISRNSKNIPGEDK